MNFRLACDRVVLPKTAPNLRASQRKANDFFAVFFSFELRGITRHLITGPAGNIREVKLDVYGKRQTAKIKVLLSVFSSLYSRIKIFLFAGNSKRHFSIFV